MPVPLPANPVIEGDYQNGPKFGVDARGDSHLLVLDVDHDIAYELYRASRPSENADGRWHADQESVWDMKTNTFRTLGYTSADAAGLSILAGLARPDEGLPVSEGGRGRSTTPSASPCKTASSSTSFSTRHHTWPTPATPTRPSSRQWVPASASRRAWTSRNSTRKLA